MVGARKHNQLRCYIPEMVIVKGHGRISQRSQKDDPAVNEIKRKLKN